MLGFLFLLASCGTKTDENETQFSQANMGSGEPVVVDEEEQGNQTETDVDELLRKLSMNTSVEQNDDSLSFHIQLTNTSDEEIELSFSSGQQYEIVITDEEGRKIYKFSEGKSFTEALAYKWIEPGESLSWTEKWEHSNEINDGSYNVKVTLLPSQINKQGFEKNPFTTDQIVEIGSDTSASLPKAPSNKIEDAIFRDVRVLGENGHYEVTGEVVPSIEEFNYDVEDGHDILIHDKKG